MIRSIAFLIILVASKGSFGQMPAFHRVTTSEGLIDGVINCFGQDKYGYIWIGTQSGLNRYDGYSVKQFLYQPGDSNSIYPGPVFSIHCSDDGNLVVGFESGITIYNYQTGLFQKIKSSFPFAALKIKSFSSHKMTLATSRGFATFDTKTKELNFLSNNSTDSNQKKLMNRWLIDFVLLPGGRWVGCSGNGLLIYDPVKNQALHKTFPGFTSNFFKNIDVSNDGSVWLSIGNEPKLIQLDADLSVIKVFDYLFPGKTVVLNAISDLIIDNRQRLWVTTVSDGICLYKEGKFMRYINDPFQKSSPVANHLTALFQDREGLIWVGSEGYGLSYFNPDKNRFQTLLPGKNSGTAGGWMWGRSASEDKDGNLWLATLDGVYFYNSQTGNFKNWQNKDGKKTIYSNSVRGVLDDGKHVWFVTGNGINRYNKINGNIDFLTERDSLPQAFYFTSYKDSRGYIWIGGRDYDGLYFSQDGKLFSGISHHPILKRIAGLGVRSIFEDSKQRLWFGLNGNGLALYDPVKGIIKYWEDGNGNPTKLNGNLITGIAEDKNHKIWVSTNAGICEYDETQDRFYHYGANSGIPSKRTSCIRVDSLNRVWVGTTRGLVMLDQKSKKWELYDENDGLATSEFGDMPSAELSDGRFIFPSLKGFLVFNPLHLQEQNYTLPLYVSLIKRGDKPLIFGKNAEDLESISLKYYQNFFSIELTALNYENPEKIWYAYKLEGFDEDWIYTKDRIINYTNVPGGNYKFLYKASLNNTDWEVPVKTLQLNIGTVFYNTFVFWALVATLFAFLLYFIYRFRMNKQRQIMLLENRTRELEKEKTVVQYEGLKQQLNPHFLFNSLTSLRSLIKTDTKSATGFLDGLSKVYRYVLRSGEHELTSLKEEIDFVNIFINLQQTRFGKGLEVCINVGEEWYGKYIVPVTLQGLVENAIKHNTADSESPLKICIKAEDDYVVVQNNLQRYQIVESSNKKGLDGLRRLYSYYTDKPIIVQEETNYFIVKIPLL